MMPKNSFNQDGANSVTLAPWHTKSRPRMQVASKAVFLENYLVVSTWILNGSSILNALEDVSTFQFSWCSQEQTLFDFVAM